jgi:hypothetical protein
MPEKSAPKKNHDAPACGHVGASSTRPREVWARVASAASAEMGSPRA